MAESRSQLLALALLVMATAVAGLAISTPIGMALETGRDIASAEERLVTIRKAIRDGTGLAQASVTGLLVGGESTGRSAAELQTKLGATARQHGVTIRSAQVMPAKRNGDLNEITVEVNFHVGTVALRGLLHSLETGAPLLIIEDLSIRTLPPAPNQAARPVQLDVNMKVRGFAAAKDKS